MAKILVWLFLGLALVIGVMSDMPNIKDINEKNVREIRKPFRMAKMNLIWDKAVLTELSVNKLMMLLSELKIQDKQELSLKKHKSEGGDKDGQMEAQLRKTLLQIMDRYRLGRQSDEPAETFKDSMQAGQNYLFKDKKLNKLWEKAERSMFTQEELKALKEEFQHHQDKVDQYHTLLRSSPNSIDAANEIQSNEIPIDHLSSAEEAETPDAKHINQIREKHRDIKDGYNKLHKLASSGQNSQEFLEPKVAGLWKLAIGADFTTDELESLHTELKHYENRLLKARYLTGELLRLRKTGGAHDEHPDTDTRLEQKLNEVSETEGDRLLQEKVAKNRRTVDKLHQDLEMRIMQRHSEL